MAAEAGQLHASVERLERPQLLLPSSSHGAPTHAYVAIYRNGRSMNLAIPLGDSSSSRTVHEAAPLGRLPTALAPAAVVTSGAGADSLTGNTGGGSHLEGPPKELQRSLNAGMFSQNTTALENVSVQST